MIEIKDIKNDPEKLKIYTLHSYYEAGYVKGQTDTKKRLYTEIKRMREGQNCPNTDYRTGFISALSSIEGYIAQTEGKRCRL